MFELALIQYLRESYEEAFQLSNIYIYARPCERYSAIHWAEASSPDEQEWSDDYSGAQDCFISVCRKLPKDLVWHSEGVFDGLRSGISGTRGYADSPRHNL